MNRFYADIENVRESIREVHEGLGETGDEAELVVVRAGRARVVAEPRERLIDRGLYNSYEEIVDDIVCHIEVTRGYLGFPLLDLTFHESVVEERLCLTPVGPGAVFSKGQATCPTKLGEDLCSALTPLRNRWGAEFTFKGVQAASVAHGGHFTDFEYEYAIDGLRV